MERRSVLAAAAALVPGGGCLSNEPSLEPGVLVVDNGQDASRTVTVEAARYTEHPGSEAPGPATPVGTPTARLRTTVRVPAGDRLTRNGFVTDPGTYHLVAGTESGLRARAWAGFYEAGSGIGGGMISVTLQENGQLTVGNPTIGA